MAEQRKRLSKNASKILFQIICEESFEGKSIKNLLPATRRISKAREGLWEYIRSELIRRSDEEYDLGTVSAAWYYNLRKIGSCLDQIEMEPTDGLTIDKLRTLDRYVCNNLGDRIRGRGKGNKGERDVKLTQTQMVTLSRQSTMDASVHFSTFDDDPPSRIGKAASLHNEGVKHKRGSSNEEKENGKRVEDSSIDMQGREDDEMEENEISQDDEIEENEITHYDEMEENEITHYDEMEENEITHYDEVEENELGEDEAENHFDDPLESIEIPRLESNHGSAFDMPLEGMYLPVRLNSPPSRYNTADTTQISRNNSTSSVSGYDADNEKGLIKRRRKELKRRGDREKVVKIEEEVEEEADQRENEEAKKGNDEEGDENEEEAEEEEEMEDEDEEDEEEGKGDERSEKMKMIDNLKGMVENLRDHIVTLRIMGTIEAADMETLMESFEHAARSIRNNIDIA